MPAQYIYNANGPFATASNVDLSARVRAYRSEATTNAEEGSTAISTFYVDDEESGINITGFRNFRWKESSEGSNSRIIYDGYTADRNVSRGPFRVQRAREWEVQVSDLNSILQRRIMRGADANRPAETDVARIQWAVSTTELNLLTDTTYISTSNPVAMDASDYRNQRVADIIDDCAQASGKNYFLVLNELYDPPRYGLFYDYATSSAYGSTVRLTNVLADVDSTTTFAVFNDDLKLNRDPSRVYPTVIVAYDGGDVYVHSDAIGNAFVSRDTLSPSWNVKTAAKATARGLRYLDDIGTEEDRLTMSYLVPLASVNQLKEGQAFQVKFSHLPGYTEWTWVRALKRTVRAESEEYYKVTLEASAGGGVSSVSCSTSIANQEAWSGHYFTDAEGGPSGYSSPVSITPDTPSSSGVMFLIWFGRRLGATMGTGDSITLTGTGWTEIGNNRDGWAGGWQTAAITGYKSVTGSPGTATAAWSSGPASTHRALSATLQLGSLVQTSGYGAAGIATFPNTPTPGNVFVGWLACEDRLGNTEPVVPTGWTLLNGFVLVPGTLGFTGMLCARCVTVADSKNVPIFSSSGAAIQWTQITEWTTG